MKNPEFIEKILILIAEYDCQEYIFWDEDLRFYVNCNDLFYWGCADTEAIKTDELGDFENSLKDADFCGPLLFVARKREMRPQGAAYNKMIPIVYHDLFNQCGPKRKVGFGNPDKQNKG